MYVPDFGKKFFLHFLDSDGHDHTADGAGENLHCPIM